MPASWSPNALVAVAVVTLVVTTGCWSHPPPINAIPVGHGDEIPIALNGVAANSLIRWPSIAVRSDTAFVAANVFPIQGDSLLPRPAYLGRLRQDTRGELVPLRELPLPPGDFQFAYPRIVASSAGLHLVWGEFALPPRTWSAWTQAPPTSLWHALLSGDSWSRPERIATSRWLGWNDESGDIALDSREAMHVVVWIGDSTPRMLHLRLSGSALEASHLPYSGLNMETAIATRGDTVVVGLVRQASDTQRVMLFESTDQGRHWASAIVASERVGGMVSHLALATTSDGQLLAIAEKGSDSFYLDTIRVLRTSRKTGRVVTRVVAPPSLSAGFAMAVAPCGSALMLIRTFSVTPQVFQFTIPPDGPATTAKPLLNIAANAVFPGAAAIGRSMITVFAYNTDRDTPARSVAMTRPACSS